MEDDKTLEVVRKEVGGFPLAAQMLAVATKEDYAAAVTLRGKIKEARVRWTGYWKPVKDSSYATWKGLCAKENEGTKICDEALGLVDRKALVWKQEADRKAAEEQRKLQAEADERARKEKERLLKQAENLKTPEKKEERMEQAEAVQAPVITVESPTAGVEDGSTRKTWKARLVDKDALIAEAGRGTVASTFLQFDQAVANAFARGTKNAVKVAGVEFYEDEGLVSKRRI